MESDDGCEELERTQIREELSNMSFEELQKLKEELGTKVYNEAMFGQARVKRQEFKRENKNRPREMSSKVPVSVLRDVPAKKSAPRDPRFDSLCGEFDPKSFKAAYSFVSEYRTKELQQLKNELKDTTDDERRDQIKYLIQRMKNQLREEQNLKKRKARAEEEKAAIDQARQEGQQPHFRNKSEKRVVNLIDKFEELKKKGKISKNLQNHRMKAVLKNRTKIHSGKRRD